MNAGSLAVVCVALGVTLAVPAQAQEWPKRRPGVWEAQINTSGANMPNMQERLANMPPEKRAQMEAYMKKQGMSFGGGGYTQTVRYCLTPQEAADEAHKTILSRFQRNIERNSHCDEKVFARTSSEVRFHATCRADDGVISDFDGRVYDISPESVALDFQGKSAKQGDFHIQQRAHWTGNDCGNLK